MVKILKNLYLISSLILILMLILASILSPPILSSLFFRICYAVYAILTLASVVFVQGMISKALHLLLALLIGTSIYVKMSNDRFPITLGTGGKYEVETVSGTLELELMDFSIRHEAGSSKAVHYESTLLVDGEQSSITVNHPYKKDRIRLYQSSYRKIIPFQFQYSDTLRLFEGQHGELKGIKFSFLEYDPILNRAAVRYNDILFYLPVGRASNFFEESMKVKPGEPEMATVLEYVEVKGHTPLLIIALAFLVTLIADRVRRLLWK